MHLQLFRWRGSILATSDEIAQKDIEFCTLELEFSCHALMPLYFCSSGSYDVPSSGKMQASMGMFGCSMSCSTVFGLHDENINKNDSAVLVYRWNTS
jgi:hypothetical protein